MIVIETEEPHGIAFYQLGDTSLEFGRSLYNNCLDKYLEAEKTGIKTHPQLIQKIELPQYGYKIENRQL